MQVGDWVFARSAFIQYEPNCRWVLARIVEEDDTHIPWCVEIVGGQDRTWRQRDRVRPPETDEEWAQVAAHILTEG